MINWKVRIRQKWFWLTIIPAALLLLDQLWGLFGLLGSVQEGHLYDGPLMEAMLRIVGTAFAIMVLIGIPVDTTTDGYGDSARALTYGSPAPNASAYGVKEYEEKLDWGKEVVDAIKGSTLSFDDASDAVSRTMRPTREGEDGNR